MIITQLWKIRVLDLQKFKINVRRNLGLDDPDMRAGLTTMVVVVKTIRL